MSKLSGASGVKVAKDYPGSRPVTDMAASRPFPNHGVPVPKTDLLSSSQPPTQPRTPSSQRDSIEGGHQGCGWRPSVVLRDCLTAML